MKLKVNNTLRGHDIYPSRLLPRTRRYPTVLSIAGSDSSGGAGIQADLKTFSVLGVYGATAITAVTAQNTHGVYTQYALPSAVVYDQIVAVMDDISPSVVKIGMLSNVEIANAVADALCRYDVPIILDPVMVASSGHRLLSVEAERVVAERLLPMATLLTPNIPEMEALTALPIGSTEEKMVAARHLLRRGAQALLLKGGHEEGDTKIDLLYQNSPQGVVVTPFVTSTIATRNVHGTGCTLSSAIAAYLARGLELSEAVGAARGYLFEAIKSGADVAIGGGLGPVNHQFNPDRMIVYEK